MNTNQKYNIHSELYKKFLIKKEDYDKIIITNILYNEKIHIVSCFKEILIYDDPGEFLKRFYNLNECIYKIKSYCEFYEKNSKIFPNYVPLIESKYIFKNIKKKQKMLDNINEDNNKEKDNENNIFSYSKIFTNSIMNSILSENNNSNISINSQNSLKKLIRNISEYENSRENDCSDSFGKNKFIEKYNNIEYNIGKGKTSNTGTRHHYKKFIKDFQIEKIPKNKTNKLKINNKNNTESKSIKINNSNSKTNLFKSTNSKKYISKISIDHMIKNLNIKIPNNNNIIKDKSKSKSKSKGKEILTERNIKPKVGIQKVTISKANKKKLIVKNNTSNQKNKKKEAKSMPKLSSSLNKKTGINKVNSFHKQIFSAANKKTQKLTNNNNNNVNIININNINYNINNNNKSLKFTNIKLQKPLNNFNIEIQLHNTNINPNNYLSKHIPSLHISLNTNFKNTSTLSKSKSKSKSNSKSKSKSPNSTSNSLNKNFRKHNTINSFNKNFKYINNNIRALIHKDIIFNSGEGLNTERIKHKSKVNKIKNNIVKKNNNSKNLNNGNNIFKRNTHKKIISSTTSSEYTKINPKIIKENNQNSNKINNTKNRIIKSNICLNSKNNNLFENKKRVYSDSQKTLKTTNKSSILHNINYVNSNKKSNIINSRGNSSNKNNNSNNYRKHPIRKIKSNEKNKNTISPLNKPSFPNKSVLSNIIKK